MSLTWQEEIAILRVAKGALYRKRRDALLAAPPPNLRASLEQLATSPDAAQATTTSILVGWMDHRQLYESVLAELDTIDEKKLRSSQVGFNMLWNGFAERAEQKWKGDVLPLCWEQITRFVDGRPDWWTITFLNMIRAVPDERSIEPVILSFESTSSRDVMDSCATTLQMLPREPVLRRAHEVFARHERLAGLIQRVVREDRP